ncbi:TraR/DksA C4-type zinc finger protein [Puniceicoccaceae bacterium K14]|nr:TraR/DksA C4-type zinc finger protein [Puniceicoccaceae bacterium K14]
MPEKKKSPTTSVSKKTAKKASKATSFSLDDALSVAKTRNKDSKSVAAKKAAKEKAQKAIAEAQEQEEKRVLGAASLADILGGGSTNGGTPKKAKINHRERKVDPQYQKFHALLVELFEHVQDGLSKHTEDTLKRSSKDDSGDLSSYSQHMADAGTETFDRDFALSMVSSEQDALHEIEAALDRIYDGTYGICEMTGKRIRDERLMAVPFTRHSIASQTQLEKNKTRSTQRGGIFTEATSEDSIAYEDDSE